MINILEHIYVIHKYDMMSYIMLFRNILSISVFSFVIIDNTDGETNIMHSDEIVIHFLRSRQCIDIMVYFLNEEGGLCTASKHASAPQSHIAVSCGVRAATQSQNGHRLCRGCKAGDGAANRRRGSGGAARQPEGFGPT